MLAPIKETLAAGIVDLAHIRRNDIVYDPFCGSGTFVIESALHALNIAPGIRRRFVAEQWDCIDRSVWKQEREAAHSRICRESTYRGYGFDLDGEAVALASEKRLQGPELPSGCDLPSGTLQIFSCQRKRRR